MPPSRSTAAAPRLSRPAARYRPGKAPVPDGDADLDSSDSEHEAQNRKPRQGTEKDNEAAKTVASGTAGLLSTQRKTAGVVISSGDHPTTTSRKVDVKLEPQQPRSPQHGDAVSSSEYETDSEQENGKPIFRKPGEQPSNELGQQVLEQSSEYETDSEESESGTDENEKPAIMLKPMFVPKKAQNVSYAAQDTEDKATALAEQRRKEAHDLAAQVIRKHIAEQEHAKQKASSSASAAAEDIDDTDGLEPDAEFQAWRLRELQRIKRDQVQASEKKAESDEIARVNALPEAERERLGVARAKAIAEEKRQQKTSANGTGGQTYYHKGSFFQDMDILKRDYSQLTERQADKNKLPKSLQARGDGVKGRSKWTSLGNEDTSKDALTIKQNTSSSRQ